MSSNADRRVFVVLGLYRPDPVLLRRQLTSLASQSHRNFEVVASCDGPLDGDSLAIVREFAHLPLHLVGSDTQVGVHSNFARGLRAAVAASRSVHDLFAFCDQDDYWYPTKLEYQVASFSDGQTSLVHCDARVITGGGGLIARSLFRHEARSHGSTFVDLLAMNSVTGMTAVFRRDVAEVAQLFPLAGCRYILHDHWVALVSSLLGSVRFIDEPLVDYTQHGRNVRGARRWGANVPRQAPSPERRIYLRRCYRQFLWRRRVLDALRGMAEQYALARNELFGTPVHALFDCNSRNAAGLALVLTYRMKGRPRQADQIWRIWMGRQLYCTRRSQGRTSVEMRPRVRSLSWFWRKTSSLPCTVAPPRL